jgi:polar amino acid transport system substrate-binding protein
MNMVANGVTVMQAVKGSRLSGKALPAQRSWRKRGGASAAAAAMVLLAACSSSTSKSPAKAADTATARFADQLPDNIRSAGVLRDVSPFTYPPYDYASPSGDLVGGEVDILNAVGPLLGVKMKYERISGFAAMIPAIVSGRFDMAGESIGITPPRRKQVAFVQYGAIGEGLLVRTGNPTGLKVTDLCGHSVAVEAGTSEVSVYPDISQKCVAAGKKKVTVNVYANNPAQVLAVVSGHDDAAGVGSTAVPAIAKASNDKLVDAGGLVPGYDLPIGFVVAKDNLALGKALESALSYLLQNGELAKINAKYNLAASLSVQFLPATS